MGVGDRMAHSSASSADRILTSRFLRVLGKKKRFQELLFERVLAQPYGILISLGFADGMFAFF